MSSNKQHPKWKRLSFSIITFLILGLFLVILGELAMRIALFAKSKNYPTRTTIADEDWGHRSLENFNWEGTVQDASGKSYSLKYTTDERGFRAFGDLNTTKKKAFFIGDSFTQAIEASDDKVYFSRLGDSLNLEVFAYGARGFSTLQELMVLKQYLPEIQPDAVVLQFCSNDFVNNHHFLEQNSLWNNNRRRRPYLDEHEAITFEVPAKVGWDWLNERSLFFQFLFTKIERVLNNGEAADAFSEYHLEHKGMAYAPFAESVKRTKTILTQMKEALPTSTSLLVFITHDDAPYFDALGDLCQELEIPFVGYIPEAIKDSDERGENTRALDGAHWNELGHQIAADILACEMADILEINTATDLGALSFEEEVSNQ